MFNEFWKQFIITKDVKLVFIFLLVMITYWLKNKLFRKLVLKIIGRTPTTLDDEIFPLMDSMLNVAIFSVGIMNLLLYFGIDIRSILTTAGVGSLALAFAVKDAIVEVISGWLIIIDKPFKVGNKIKLYSGEYVTVIDIGLRKSRFLYKTYDDSVYPNTSVLIISNSELIKNKVYNYSYAENLK